MRWKKTAATLALASFLFGLGVQAAEVSDGTCHAERSTGEASLDDLLAAAHAGLPLVARATPATTVDRRYPFLAAPGAAFDLRVQTQFVVTPAFRGPRPFGKPSGVTIDAISRFRPLALVDASGTVGWEFLRARYGELRTGTAILSATVSDAGEAYGTWAMDEAIRRGVPPTLAWISSAGTQTTVEFAGGLVLAGPNLVLLPEALAGVPEQLGHGASDVVDGVRSGNSKQALLGVAHTLGAIGTVAGAITLLAKGPRLAESLIADDPVLAARVAEARSALRTAIVDETEAERVGVSLETTGADPPDAPRAAGVVPAPPGAHVYAFWSGAQGLEAAEQSGMRLISDTSYGANAEINDQAMAQQGIGWEDRRPQWVFASQTYALEASGDVHVYLESSVPHPDSVWASVEEPTLRANPNVTSITYHCLDTGLEYTEILDHTGATP